MHEIHGDGDDRSERACRYYVHVDAVPEAAEESLAVVLEHAVEERAAEVAGGELLDVDELHPAAVVLRRRRAAAAVVLEERGADDAAAHAVVGGELLERRPPEVLLVVVVPLLRRRATERVVRLRLPERLRDRRPQLMLRRPLADGAAIAASAVAAADAILDSLLSSISRAQLN